MASIFVLSDVWAWWVQQMADMLPSRLLSRRAVPATALVVAPDIPDGPADGSVAETGSLSARRHRRERPLGRFALNEAGNAAGLAALRRSLARRGRRVPVVLRLAPDLLLEREVSLPLAAEPEAGNALRFGIDTLTPFAGDELFWSWTVMRRDRAHGRLHVRLSLVCKTAVQPLIAALERAGATPRLLEIPLSDSETRVIALGDSASRAGRLRRHVPAAIGGFAAGAAVAMAVLPVALQMRALAATEARIDALRPRVAQVEAFRRETGRADGIDVIAGERARVGDALQVIAMLTTALPDDTHLTELSLHQRKLALTGEFGAAAKLIVALSAEPMLRETEFVAPVTRAPMGGRDIFSIQAEVTP